jgi:hypothetical protein
MKKGLLAAIAFVCVSFLNHSLAQQMRTVHLVGFTNEKADAAAYWKDGVLTALPIDASFSKSKANGIFVHGGDVHIVGFQSNGSELAVRYWKNGAPVPITSNGAFLEDVAMASSDVYIVGKEYDKKGNRFAQYWKNGQPSALNKKKTGEINGLTISGTDVYIVGTEKAPKKNKYNYYPTVVTYWKNGLATSVSSGETDAVGYDIFVSGNDVYVAGTERSPAIDAAKYWKNGTAMMLTDGKKDASAKGIYVSGGDVYVVGYTTPEGKYTATFWKNGVATELGPRTASSAAQKVVVVDGDVYIAGYEMVNMKPVARCWKNGVPMEVDGVNGSMAMALFVE